MGKVFTDEDIRMIASHMTPIMDRMAEIRKENDIDYLSVYVWKEGDFTVKINEDWYIHKNGERVIADHTEAYTTKIVLSEASND